VSFLEQMFQFRSVSLFLVSGIMKPASPLPNCVAHREFLIEGFPSILGVTKEV
jgi:hypothetical protein